MAEGIRHSHRLIGIRRTGRLGRGMTGSGPKVWPGQEQAGTPGLRSKHRQLLGLSGNRRRGRSLLMATHHVSTFAADETRYVNNKNRPLLPTRSNGWWPTPSGRRRGLPSSRTSWFRCEKRQRSPHFWSPLSLGTGRAYSDCRRSAATEDINRGLRGLHRFPFLSAQSVQSAVPAGMRDSKSRATQSARRSRGHPRGSPA